MLEHMLQPLRSLPDSLTPGTDAPRSHILGPGLCGLARRHCGGRANADLDPPMARRRLWNSTDWASINGIMSIGREFFGWPRCAWDRTSCFLVADFHLVSFQPALILLPRASRPPSIWPLALDCLGRESPGSNSPSVPRLPCSHAEILHCRACADTAFCPPGRLLACFRDLLQRPQVSPNILYGSHTSPRHAELLGAVSAEISSHLGRTGWTSSWTHQADSGCSSPGIIPESYLLELADHHPQRGRPPHGVKGARPPLNPRSLALMLCLPLDPASDLTFPCLLR